MLLKLFLLTTLVAVTCGQGQKDLENDIISICKDILYYIHKDSTKETKWTVFAVLSDVMDSIMSVYTKEAPCRGGLQGYFHKLFNAIKDLEGNEVLEAVLKMIVELLDDGKYLLSGSLLLTGQAVQEVVGILVAIIVNTLNSVDVFDSISQYLVDVYKTNIMVIDRISLLLLQSQEV